MLVLSLWTRTLWIGAYALSPVVAWPLRCRVGSAWRLVQAGPVAQAAGLAQGLGGSASECLSVCVVCCRRRQLRRALALRRAGGPTAPRLCAEAASLRGCWTLPLLAIPPGPFPCNDANYFANASNTCSRPPSGRKALAGVKHLAWAPEGYLRQERRWHQALVTTHWPRRFDWKQLWQQFLNTGRESRETLGSVFVSKRPFGIKSPGSNMNKQ